MTMNKTVSVPRPCLTRWTSMLNTIEAIQVSKAAFRSLALMEGETFELSETVKQLILSSQFWTELNKLKTIIKPLVKANVVLQSIIFIYLGDTVNSSDAFHLISFIFSSYVAPNFFSELTARESHDISLIVVDRYKKLYDDAMGVGYFLDPRFMALETNFLSANLSESLETFIADNCHLFYQSATPSIARLEISNFRNFIYSATDRREYFQKNSPLQFWTTDSYAKKLPVLAAIATRVFSVNPSSSSSERHFSKMGFIDSPRRGRMLSKTLIESARLSFDLISLEKKQKSVESMYSSPFPYEEGDNYQTLQKEYFGERQFNVSEAIHILWDLELNGVLPAELVDAANEEEEESSEEEYQEEDYDIYSDDNND